MTGAILKCEFVKVGLSLDQGFGLTQINANE